MTEKEFFDLYFAGLFGVGQFVVGFWAIGFTLMLIDRVIQFRKDRKKLKDTKDG